MTMQSLSDHGCSDLMMEIKSATFSKELEVLSWRQGTILSRPNKRSMAWILMLQCLTLVKWSPVYQESAGKA